MTDHERVYVRCATACGEPFPEFVALFESLPVPSSVLDLGAGQGRDTLVAARLGHSVVAVDVSPTGIGQILEVAKRERLSIEGIVSDLRSYVPERQYGVVVLDRVVHMLKDVEDKRTLLSRAARATTKGGYTLVADTPSNRECIDAQFGDRNAWQQVESRKGRRIFRRRISAS